MSAQGLGWAGRGVVGGLEGALPAGVLGSSHRVGGGRGEAEGSGCLPMACSSTCRWTVLVPCVRVSDCQLLPPSVPREECWGCRKLQWLGKQVQWPSHPGSLVSGQEPPSPCAPPALHPS